MPIPSFVMPKYISLKECPDINEEWLKQRLIENPELLGLGDELELHDSERRQPSRGRLDLLFEDRNVEPQIRYEVEVMLGALDESHIIRTVEYWDIERRSYPQYEHIAVIVAEDVTSRFLNVISLFNGTIPLIAIQLRGVEVDGKLTLVATRVLDVIRLGTIDDDNPGDPVGRPDWERQASRDSMEITDRLFDLMGEVQAGLTPRYNKYYIGIEHNGLARNFVAFNPRRSKVVLTEFKISQDDELTAKLDESGLTLAPYESRYGKYRVRIRQADLDQHREILLELIKRARDADSRIQD